MKVNIIILVLAILLMAAVVSAAPHLTIKNAAFDFGFVPQHSKVSHVFWLHSDGTDTLKITRVQPG